MDKADFYSAGVPYPVAKMNLDNLISSANGRDKHRLSTASVIGYVVSNLFVRVYFLFLCV